MADDLPRRHTLAAMAKPEKTEGASAAPPPSRTPNPWVLVSRRKVLLQVPLAMLAPDFTNFPRNTDGTARVGPLGTLVVEPGPNVLAAYATVFAYEEAPTNVSVRAEPPANLLRAVHLQPGHAVRLDEFTDPVTLAVDCAALEAAFLRALRWLADKANAPLGAPWQRFEVQRGFDTPDLAVVQTRDLFGTGDTSYRTAELARVGCRHAKNEAHLGAAHDLAMRHGSLGAHVAQACRERRRAFQPR